MIPAAYRGPIEMWGGVECTVNRIGDRWFDQLRRSGHDSRDDDLERFAALGLRTIRYPVLWERVAPNGLDGPDWRWSDARLRRLRELGISPIVGLLHHGSGPADTSLIAADFPEKLARYAGMVAARYPWVTDFTPVNEPLTTARFSGLYGTWYPHGTDDRTFARALWNQIRGTALAMAAIREVTPSARLIQTEDCGCASGTPAMASQIRFEGDRRWLTWDLLTGRVVPGHALWDHACQWGIPPEELIALADTPSPPDILGLNYYLTSDRYLDENLDGHPASSHGGNGTVAYADVDAARASPHGIVGHEAHLMAAWERYEIPVALTEVHLSCTREEQLRWLLESWTAAGSARARGADVRAVTTWALFGSFDWDSLVTRAGGHYEPGVYDLRSGHPVVTALGPLVRAFSRNEPVSHPIFEGDGWWRRPYRIRSGNSWAESAQGSPILIAGSDEELVLALIQACKVRGLAACGLPMDDDRTPWALLITGDDPTGLPADMAGADCRVVRIGDERCRQARNPLELAHQVLDQLIDAYATFARADRPAPSRLSNEAMTCAPR